MAAAVAAAAARKLRRKQISALSGTLNYEDQLVEKGRLFSKKCPGWPS